ncbi:hypothetical protein [Streptomyces sp. NPDC093707]|uniref:hypothetical protein n=1 Tax=Streptomyces sp. NPDC093707 TaxID=3154984 RepID=UPI00344BFCDC
MANTAAALHLFHAIAIPAPKSTVRTVVRIPHHPVIGSHAKDTLRHQAALCGGILTTVYAPDSRAARTSVRRHADDAYAALHGRHATLAKRAEQRAVIFRTASFDTTGEFDVVTVTREPACMYAGHVWADYLSSQHYDRYVVTAPSDGAALNAARELFYDELYASFTA